MGRLNAMCGKGSEQLDLEDRVYDLLGELKSPFEIAAELRMERREGCALVAKVIRERDTPQGVAVRESLRRLAEVRI
jgi:hypothetical protein